MKKSLPLFQAIFDKNEVKFLKLAKSGKFPLNETEPSGRMLLSLAVIAEMPDAVAFLLEHQPELNSGDEKGWTALHFASYCNNVGIAKQLLPVFPDVDVKDNNGNTPLWRAVYEEQVEIAGYLVSAGADPGLKNNNGDSPLALAQAGEHEEMIGLMTP
ncbi:MAG: ankyrin repeat protein [Neolewinella sp.]|jgi:ankyrin repeat protein